jgi:hypothetical protein
MEKPHAIVFSSGKSIPIGEGVKLNLQRDFTVDLWTEGFFNRNNTPPLNVFLKKLLCYDLAVLVLGADDVQLGLDGSTRTHVPRDNVIFELGATMARMGTQKTFLLTPDNPVVKLPSYFTGIEPLSYEVRDDGNNHAGTGAACIQIRDRIKQLDQDVFHSDLPALGLAYGYFFNFVLPVYSALRERQSVRFAKSESNWTPEQGFMLNIVIPDSLMTRHRIDDYMAEQGLENVHVLLKDGRDVSVYVRPRESEMTPLEIFDIPTTLLTSEKVIQCVDSFWGGGDRAFKDVLIRREIAAFARRIRALIREEQLSDRRVQVRAISEIAFQG